MLHCNEMNCIRFAICTSYLKRHKRRVNKMNNKIKPLNPLVFSFKELDMKMLSLAGGKGGTLARLSQKGFRVPDGFVILPDAFVENELKPEAWEQILVQLKRITKENINASFAVRSSGLAEDSALAAFPGQFETILDVNTENDILKAIYTVHQSKDSERVKEYSKVKGIDYAHEISIVVQLLIRSEISGVMFTADPITGSINTMSGSYVYGMGEQLVSGESDAFEFTFKRPKGEFDGPGEFKKYAKRLFSLCKKVEKVLGCPQDIEWAIVNNKVYLLQSRPITTLIGYDPISAYHNESLKGDYFWAFAGVGELLPDILLPADWSIWKMYNHEFMEHDWFLPHQLYANIAGRVYTNGSVMVSGMKKFRYSEERIHDLFSEAMGEIPDGMTIPYFHIPWKTMLTNTIPSEFKWQRRVKKLQKNIPSFLDSNAKICSRLRKKIDQTDRKEALAELWKNEIKPAYGDSVWMMKVANEVFYNPLNALSIELGKIVGKSDSNILIQGRPKGAVQLESLGPLLGLKDIIEGKISREEYMKKYGHRDTRENYLTSPRPIENPEWLDIQLKNYTPLNIEDIMVKRIGEFDAAAERLKQTVKPKKANKYLQKIETLIEEMHIREELRSELTRCIWITRLFFLRAGKLTDLHDDVFYLSIDELLDILQDQNTEVLKYISTRKEFYTKLEALPPYPGIINGRFDPFQWVKDPDRRLDIFDSHIDLPKEIEKDPNVIKGLPGSTGRVEGTVRLLNNIEEGNDLQPGEIVVTRTTNVGWTPLFGRAGGVVTDIGSPLAHAAIVARELGIPATVGCGDATRRLKTGDRVIIDGGKGFVTIVT
jgi:pyruvate,water dikinase